MTGSPYSAPVETVRKRKLEATQRLLGDTIGLSDEAWHSPSALPGWTRAHVATHVSRNADAFRQLTLATLGGSSATLYPDERERFVDIERGVERTGLDLQIDLDTSANALAKALDRVDDWTLPVRLLGRDLTLDQVPLARLNEVVLHHLDLATGFGPDHLDPVPARWLLLWRLGLWEGKPGPRLRVQSDSGVEAEVGTDGDPRLVTGSDAALWAWLSGRGVGEGVRGASGLSLPLA